MKIYYKKENGQFVGAGNISKKLSVDSEIESKEFDTWSSFRKENSDKDLFVINGELVAKERPIQIEDVRKIIISISRLYLNNTDWYELRYLRNGKDIPGNIAQNREDAILNINLAQDAITLEELNNININYEDK